MYIPRTDRQSLGLLLYIICPALVILFATTVSGNAPNINYSHNMRILKLPRNLPIGTIVYRLKGSDPDPDKLVFGTRDPVGSKLFEIKSISFTEADVILKSRLEEKEYNLTVFVSDGRKSTEVPSTVIVTDPVQHDSPFVDMNLLFAVSENATRNTTIGSVVARDRADSNLRVTFELRGSDKFAIRYVFGPRGTSKAEIVLVQAIDYEKQTLYELTILALNAFTDESVDTRNVATATILIAVKDVQDTAPTFRGLPNVVSLSEEMSPGTTIIVVHAEDGDYGSQRNVTYSLPESQYSKFFDLSKDTGVLTLARPLQDLKRELGSGTPFLLPIKATEIDEFVQSTQPLLDTTDNLAFVIISSENHAPHFPSSRMEGSIIEHAPPMTPVRWTANSIPRVVDGDPGMNGTFSLIIEGGSDVFTIQPSSGVNDLTFAILVKNGSALDFEKPAHRTLVLTIIAQDHCVGKPLATKIVCVINITDTNDHYPQFSQSSYEAMFYEDSPIGKTIAHVQAFDEDSGPYGKIKYTSITGAIANNLQLDEETGLITLKSLKGIDRETSGNYRLIVEARDENGLGNKNTTVLNVLILDANDNAPTFLQGRYDAVLNSDRQSFTQPLVVKATDADDPSSLNSNVTYEIIAGNIQDKFEIDMITGEITLKSPLQIERSSKVATPFNDDKFAPAVVLTVRAHDQGIPYMSSTVMVYVHSQDYLNRTISFIMKDTADRVRVRKEAIERGLSAVTGAQVHIYKIQSSTDRTNGNLMSVLEAWVAYPVRATVDLRNLADRAADILGTETRMAQQRDAAAASVYNGDYDTIVWILVAMIILIVIFLVGLFTWCICARNQYKKEPLIPPHEREDPTKSRISMNDRTSMGNGSSRWRNDRGYDEPDRIPLNEADEEFRDDMPSDDRGGRFKRLRMNRNQRVRVAPETYDDNYSYSDGDPSRDYRRGGYRRARGSRRMIDMGHSNGTYTLDEEEEMSQDSRMKPKRTEILYIRSPPPQPRFDGPRSVSETEMAVFEADDDLEESESGDGRERSRSQGTHRAKRQVSFKVGSRSRQSKEPVNDDDTPIHDSRVSVTRRPRSVSQVTLSSQAAPSEDSQSMDGKPRRASLANPSTASSQRSAGLVRQATLPGSVEDEGDRDERPASHTHPKMLHEIESDEGIPSDDARGRKSDSDSGLGRSKHVSDLNLKNSNLMQKKSIFTIAYDGVRTDRIKSAESGVDTP